MFASTLQEGVRLVLNYKSALHAMLLDRGLAIPVYDNGTRMKDGKMVNWVRVKVTLGTLDFQEEGEMPKRRDAEATGCEKMFLRIRSRLAGIPVLIRKPKDTELGDWRSLKEAGKYSQALSAYCAEHDLGEPIIEHLSQKHRLHTGGNSAGRVGSIGRKKSHLKVTAGGVQREVDHPKMSMAIELACSHVLAELTKNDMEGS